MAGNTNKKQEKLTQAAIAFQPDAIEIKNERLPIWARFSVIFCFIFFLAALLWATFGKVDVVVNASGKLVSDQQSIVMKPLERSVISKIHVKIGDVVEKDQLLITFDPTLNEADVERLRNEITVLQAKYDRLRAEFNKAFYKPAVLNAATREQQAIFRQRSEYYISKIRYYDEAVKQLNATEQTKKDTLKNQIEQLAKVRQLENMYEELRGKQAATLKELLSVQLSRIEIEGNIDSVRNSLQELIPQRESLVSSKDSFIHEWNNSIVEELVSVGRELDRNRKEFKQAEKMVSFVELRAPCRAVIHEIASFPVGSAVREAEAIITLIPLDGKIELEARVEPKDIGKVRIGSEVRIKLGAYPFQKYGTLHGVVRNLSENTLQKQPEAAQKTALAGASTYYRALITVEGKLRNTPENFRLIPGMETEAEIKTGTRRIIEYIIYPLIKALDETAREP